MRIRALDLGRGFTVLLMAPVHFVLVFSWLGIRNNWAGITLGFLAEVPGAPLFMILMGICFGISSRNSLTGSAARAIRLAGLGYLLNICKFVIPYALGILPAALLRDLGIPPGQYPWAPLLLVGDILQFASLSLLLMALLIRIPGYRYLVLLLILLVPFLSPQLWNTPPGGPLDQYVLALFRGNNPMVFFPVFPWIIFPLAGLILGRSLRDTPPRPGIWTRMGLLFLAFGFLLFFFQGNIRKEDFYHMGPGMAFIHLGAVMIWIRGCFLICNLVPDNPVFRALYYLSRHITRIYFLQWVIVCWLLVLLPYRGLGLSASLAGIALINLPVLLASRWIDRTIHPGPRRGMGS